MERIRDVLPANLWKTMVRKLGREESLRLLWSTVVGPKLAAQTSLRQLRGGTLVVSVPDAQWGRSLQPLEKMILDAVSRFPDSWRAKSIKFVTETRPVAGLPGPRPGRLAASNKPRENLASSKFAGQRPWEAYIKSEHTCTGLPEESKQ